MKKLRFALLLAPVVLFAADGAKNGQKKPAPPKAAMATKLAVPQGAVAQKDGTWRFTDSNGQRWIYRDSPFGITRVPDTGKEEPVQEQTAGMKASEVDGQIHFERPGPFGPVRWVRTKDQMNEAERKVWERDCAPSQHAPKE